MADYQSHPSTLDSAAPFEYTAINATKQIRLLKILCHDGRPRNRGDAILIELDVHDRDSAPAYESLSYTWGDPNERKAIACNGYRLPVTLNCFEALQALRTRQLRKNRGDVWSSRHVPAWVKSLKSSRSVTRPDDTVVHLWIDAICINQSDVDERNAQVSIMGSIFQEAFCTAVYLGRTDDSARVILTYIEHLRISTLELGESPHYLDAVPSDLLLQWLDDCKILYSRPWFTRTWIVQEALLSNKLTVLIGEEEFLWDILALGSRLCADFLARKMENWFTHPLAVIARNSPREQASHIVFSRDFAFENAKLSGRGMLLWDSGVESTRGALKALYTKGGAQSFGYHDVNVGGEDTAMVQDELVSSTFACTVEDNVQVTRLFVPPRGGNGPAENAAALFFLMADTADLQCSDPRDKLFALRSLLTSESLDLAIDYSKSVSDTFADLSWYLLSHGVFATLSYASLRQNLSAPRLPSWVVDWTICSSEKQPYGMLNTSSPSWTPPDPWERPAADRTLIMRRAGRCIAIPGRILHDQIVKTDFTRCGSEGRYGRFLTQRGAWGTFQTSAQTGDVLCLFAGCKEPFILRESQGGWRLIGQCTYSHAGRMGVKDTGQTDDMDWAKLEAGALQTVIHDIWLV